MSNEVYVAVGAGEPEDYFQILGVYDNEDSARIAYADGGGHDSYNYGVFRFEAESTYSDGVVDRDNQKSGESVNEWIERTER